MTEILKSPKYEFNKEKERKLFSVQFWVTFGPVIYMSEFHTDGEITLAVNHDLTGQQVHRSHEAIFLSRLEVEGKTSSRDVNKYCNPNFS